MILLRYRSAILRGTPIVTRPLRIGCAASFSTDTLAQSSTNSRITKTLYRQLLQWCKESPPVPLTTLVPPAHLESPDNVDAFRLEVLAMPASDLDDPTVAKVRRMLPPQTEVERTSLTVPIYTIDDVRNIIRSVFRLNTAESTDHQKHRLGATFTALKSLNELSGGLESIEHQRQSHVNRRNVDFFIGQVVQHEEERWRGVIASWSRPEGSKTPAEHTSLTTKDYSQAAESMVTYDIILDAGDAHGMGSSSGWSRAGQSELKLVEDTALQRIQSGLLKDYFTKFNANKKRFVPNDLVGYQFPNDDLNDVQMTSLPTRDAKLCMEMVTAAQEFASRLERCILDETSCPKERNLTVLDNILERLQSISSGDVFSRKERYLQKDLSPTTIVAHHLHALLNLQLEVVDVNHQRRISKENKPKIKFALGDIVRHKKYGFRGVVATWDPKPTVDVRRWDGLSDIENPMEKPFYHVIPDQNDCIEAFGGPRPARYVCEENLEVCPQGERESMSVDLDPVWVKTEKGYKAPQAIQYRFGEDLDDDGVTERCMTRMQDEFNSLYLLARQSSPTDTLAAKLSMETLFDFLSIADNAQDANAAQETIKEMRKAHVRRDLRWRLESGVSELLSGQGENAIEIYRIVLAEDPRYAEAWNKLATCQYMYGRVEESLESTQKVLEIDPTHLQAIIGLGLIHFENEEYQEAVKCFRKAIALDPWSPIGAKLSMTLDLLDKIIIREEILD